MKKAVKKRRAVKKAAAKKAFKRATPKKKKKFDLVGESCVIVNADGKIWEPSVNDFVTPDIFITGTPAFESAVDAEKRLTNMRETATTQMGFDDGTYSDAKVAKAKTVFATNFGVVVSGSDTKLTCSIMVKSVATTVKQAFRLAKGFNAGSRSKALQNFRVHAAQYKDLSTALDREAKIIDKLAKQYV